MSGLFEKDLRMIMQRKKVFIIFVLLAVFIGYIKLVLNCSWVYSNAYDNCYDRNHII